MYVSLLTMTKFIHLLVSFYVYILLACTHHTVVQFVHQTMTGISNLEHFLNTRHLFCYSFFLTASVPQKENDIFTTLSVAQHCLLT